MGVACCMGSPPGIGQPEATGTPSADLVTKAGTGLVAAVAGNGTFKIPLSAGPLSWSWP